MRKRTAIVLLTLIFMMVLSGSLFAYSGNRGSFQGSMMLSEEEFAELQASRTQADNAAAWGSAQRGMYSDTAQRYPMQFGQRGTGNTPQGMSRRGSNYYSTGMMGAYTPQQSRGGYMMNSQMSSAAGYRMPVEDCLYLETGERQYVNRVDDETFSGRPAPGTMGRGFRY